MRQRAIQEAGMWQDGSLAVEYMWHGMYAGAIEPSWLLQRKVFGPGASPTPLIWVMPIASPPGSDRPLFVLMHEGYHSEGTNLGYCALRLAGNWLEA